MSTLSENQRHKGHVKFFNPVKGFGFILPNNNNDNIEVFVHHTAIHNDGGFKSLAEGEEVEYDLVEGPKGMQASNVTGPNGISVKGAPKIMKTNKYRYNQQQQQHHVYYNGGYMIDPYTSLGYTYYGQPPTMYPQYVYNPQFMPCYNEQANANSNPDMLDNKERI